MQICESSFVRGRAGAGAGEVVRRTTGKEGGQMGMLLVDRRKDELVT